MTRVHVSALIALATAFAFGLPTVAQAQTTVNISGLNENSEGACSQATVIIVQSDCTYTAQRAGAFYGWAGPNVGGGFYAAGSTGDDFNYAPVPGDGKIRPTISGSLIINGSGAGATVEGTFIMGAAVRNTVVGNLTRGVERWDSITHTLASTAVTTAAPNAGGGFDYVIGSNGKPGVLCLTADPSKCYPAEVGSDPLLFDVQNIWNNDVPPTVGVEGTTLNGGPTPNIGATTTAVISNYTSSCAVPNDCANGRVVWSGPTGEFAENPGWDNLILAISTDAAGNITSGEAWWTEESLINVGPVPRETNSWQGSRFTFTGAAEGATSACSDFGVNIVGGSANNEIDARTRCTGFSGTPNISIVTGAANGTATINGAGNIVYTPNGGFSGTDTLTYNGNDGATGDNGVLTLTVSPDPAPMIADGSIDAGVSNVLALTVTLGNGSAAEHALSVTMDGASGECTTAIAGSFSVRYTPNSGFAGQDACTLTLTDANGDSDTALISITVPDEVVAEIDGGGSAQDPWSLALLGVLAVLLRRRNSAGPRALPFAANAGLRLSAIGLAVAFAAPVVADDWIRDGVYMGAGVIGTALKSDDPSAVTRQLDASLAGNFEDFPVGGQLYAGWMWSSESGIELRYADSGDGDSGIRLRSTVTGDITDIGDIEASIKGYTVYLVRQIPDLPLSDRWSIYGKAGWTFQDLDTSFRSSGSPDFPPAGSASENTNGAAIALGVRWRLARRFAVAGEAETLWVNFDDAFDEPWRIGLSIEYWFGSGKTAD
jgi:hypothetical protein